MKTRKSGQAICLYYDHPSNCEYAVRTDGRVFVRGPVQSQYGLGKSRWTPASEYMSDRFIGLPKFVCIGFTGTHQRLTTDINRIQLPKE